MNFELTLLINLIRFAKAIKEITLLPHLATLDLENESKKRVKEFTPPTIINFTP